VQTSAHNLQISRENRLIRAMAWAHIRQTSMHSRQQCGQSLSLCSSIIAFKQTSQAVAHR
jgi:hypothetical protein